MNKIINLPLELKEFKGINKICSVCLKDINEGYILKMDLLREVIVAEGFSYDEMLEDYPVICYECYSMYLKPNEVLNGES